MLYEDKEQMIEDTILADFLDNATETARENIKKNGSLTTEDAIPLMLKSQFNHIAHLEQNMVTKDEFNSFKDQFGLFKEQFGSLKEQFGSLKEQFGSLKEDVKSLERKMVTKDEFKLLKGQFKFMQWIIGLGFTIIFALNIYIGFIK